MQIAGRIERVEARGSSPLFPADHIPDGSDLTTLDRAASFTPKSCVDRIPERPAVGPHRERHGAACRARAAHAGTLFARSARGDRARSTSAIRISRSKSAETGRGRFAPRAGAVALRGDRATTRASTNFIYKRFTGARVPRISTVAARRTGLTDSEFRQIVYSQRDANFTRRRTAGPVRRRAAWRRHHRRRRAVRRGARDLYGRHQRAAHPAVRLGGGVYWRDANWFVRVDLLHAFAQNNTADLETPTDGYNLLKAEIAYTKDSTPSGFGPRELRVGVTGNNLLNEDIRNAVSFKKDEVLMPGANVRAFATLKF